MVDVRCVHSIVQAQEVTSLSVDFDSPIPNSRLVAVTPFSIYTRYETKTVLDIHEISVY